jgi:serine/threonine protein kinase
LDDLYSCGATLYRLVTGKLPNMLFKSDETLDELHRHNLPAAVVALIARAMAVDPQQRFQSSESFADALRQLGG